MIDKPGNISIECPVPNVETEVITLGHGSGGALTNRLLDLAVFQELNNPHLQNRHDGAMLDLKGPVAFTTDSFVISPIFFPGGNIGELAVNGTVNDLAMCGAIPEYLSLGFILEEGLDIASFKKVLAGVSAACRRAGVEVVTGDTKVVEKGKADKVFINTTGIGKLHKKANIDPKRVKPGDAIIVSGPIASHGIAIMSLREGLSFETTITSDTQSLSCIISSVLDKFGHRIHLLRDATRGGVATVLNEIATQSGVGIEINEAQLPVLPEVNGACEMFGLDPLYVANEGVFCAFIDGQSAEDCVSLLRSLPGGENAVIIGKVVAEHPQKVVLNSTIGGRRIIRMLPGDQLPRIC